MVVDILRTQISVVVSRVVKSVKMNVKRSVKSISVMQTSASVLVLQKVASELHPKVRNHGEGPY